MNATLVIQLVGIVFGSNIVLELLKRFLDRKDTPERIMLRALGEEKLNRKLRKWLHSDVRPVSEWRVIEALYKGYTALGGNGEIKKLYEEASQLKTTE